MLEYEITATHINAHGSVVNCKQAELVIVLAAVSACILKNMERVAPIISFNYRAITVRIHSVRQDSPPKMLSIDYVIEVDTDENDRKLALMHDNIKKYGTVYNTLVPGTELSGTLQRSAT